VINFLANFVVSDGGIKYTLTMKNTVRALVIFMILALVTGSLVEHVYASMHQGCSCCVDGKCACKGACCTKGDLNAQILNAAQNVIVKIAIKDGEEIFPSFIYQESVDILLKQCFNI
jgi:hypothetical protein